MNIGTLLPPWRSSGADILPLDLLQSSGAINGQPYYLGSEVVDSALLPTMGAVVDDSLSYLKDKTPRLLCTVQFSFTHILGCVGGSGGAFRRKDKPFQGEFRLGSIGSMLGARSPYSLLHVQPAVARLVVAWHQNTCLGHHNPLGLRCLTALIHGTIVATIHTASSLIAKRWQEPRTAWGTCYLTCSWCSILRELVRVEEMSTAPYQ